MPACRTCSADVAADGRCLRCGAPPVADVVSSDGPAPFATGHRLSDWGVQPGERPARVRSRTRAAVVAAAGLLTVGVAGAAVAAGSFLSGGGTQPEDVLPAEAFGFVKVDLDPSAGQKLAAYRLAQKFPDSGVSSESSLRDDLLTSVLDAEDDAKYEAHLQPWLGSRAGVAWLPPSAEAPDDPRFVAAVQVRDRAAAQEGLTALRDGAPEGVEPWHWAFTANGDYVLLSDEQSAVDHAVDAPQHLADDEQFADAVAALGGDQVALGWLDVAGVWQALPEEQRAAAVAETPGLAPEGTVVVGAHVDDDGVEVLGRSLGFSAGDSPELAALLDTSLGRTAPTGLVEQLPADSAVAVGLTGLGEGLGQLYTSFADDLAQDEEVTTLLDTYGLRLPDDLEALLGSELAVGVGGALDEGAPRVDVRVRTPDPARALELLELARSSAEAAEVPGLEQVEVEQVDGGYTVHYPAGDVSGAGGLGSSDAFDRTVPDADSSGVTYYVDVAGLVGLADASGGLTEQQRRNLEPITAAGYTARLEDGGNGTFRLRVTVD